MELFEYIAVAASLICSFIAVRILGGVADAARADARYWVHAAWLFQLLCLLSIQWWFFWSYHDVAWNYGRFILALSPLGLLYVVCSLLIPANAAEITSWRDHYFEIRVRLFALCIATLVAMLLCTVVLLEHPVIHPRRVLPGSLGILFAVGMISENPRLHAGISVVYTVLLVTTAIVYSAPASYGVTP